MLSSAMKGKLPNLRILENMEEQAYLKKKGIQHIYRSLLQNFKLSMITACFCGTADSTTFREEKICMPSFPWLAFLLSICIITYY